MSFMGESLTPNVQVLSVDYSSDNHSSIYLLRLEHIYEKQEDQLLSTSASVTLQVPTRENRATLVLLLFFAFFLRVRL